MEQKENRILNKIPVIWWAGKGGWFVVIGCCCLIPTWCCVTRGGKSRGTFEKEDVN